MKERRGKRGGGGRKAHWKEKKFHERQKRIPSCKREDKREGNFLPHMCVFMRMQGDEREEERTMSECDLSRRILIKRKCLST